MISGELDILKDWCYEAVSRVPLSRFSLTAKQSRNSQKAGVGLRAGHFPSMCIVLGSIPSLQK